MSDSQCNPAIIAPTYNNAATIADIVTRIAALKIPLFVVNDGSTDQTAEILAALAGGQVRILTHSANHGKAAAMQTGFAAAAEAGFSHALTIDTDGQLDPEQIPNLIDLARGNPQSLVLGVRDDQSCGYPYRSRLGRKISNHLIRLECGLRVSDSQCGLRVYPLSMVEAIRCRAGRFGFETEIITRAGWAGCAVVEAPANCRYLPPERRISHFRPVVDSVRAGLMHIRLMARTFNPWPHPQWPQRPKSRPTLASLMRWLSPREAWRQLRHEPSGHTMFATGLALGVFIANLPIYGAQTAFSLYASRRLHLHPAPVVLGTQVSMPPIGLVMIVLAIYVGHLMLHGSFPEWPEGGWTLELIWRLAPSLLLSWTAGSIVVGLAMAAVTYMLTIMLFRVLLPRRQAQEEVAD